MALLINLNFQLLISLSDIKNIKAKKNWQEKITPWAFYTFFHKSCYPLLHQGGKMSYFMVVKSNLDDEKDVKQFGGDKTNGCWTVKVNINHQLAQQFLFCSLSRTQRVSDTERHDSTRAYSYMNSQAHTYSHTHSTYLKI